MPSTQAAFFNFTASHDGIGVRPLEGILPSSEIDALIDVVAVKTIPSIGRKDVVFSWLVYEESAIYRDPASEAVYLYAAWHNPTEPPKCVMRFNLEQKDRRNTNIKDSGEN